MDVYTQWLPSARVLVQSDAEPSSMTGRRCAVLGIGSPLMGDDGLGIHVLQALQQDSLLSGAPLENIDLIDGGTLGYLLIDRLSGYDAMIVVDAANLRAPPGTVRVLCDEALDAFLSDRSATSVHEVSLIDLLQMLQLNNEAPETVALIGVQPALIDWSTDLTPEVAASVSLALDEVRRLVALWMEGGRFA